MLFLVSVSRSWFLDFPIGGGSLLYSAASAIYRELQELTAVVLFSFHAVGSSSSR
jgi:hypothetical protein